MSNATAWLFIVLLLACATAGAVGGLFIGYRNGAQDAAGCLATADYRFRARYGSEDACDRLELFLGIDLDG